MRRGGDNIAGRVRCAFESLEQRRILSASIVIPPIAPPNETGATIARLNGNLGAFTSVSVVGASAQPRTPISFSRGIYRLIGAGTGIGGASDQYTFASRLAAGDGSIVVRVSSFLNAIGSAKGGIQFSSSLAGNSAFAGIYATPSNGVTFTRRLTDGGTASSSTTFVSAPRFLKLTREGNSLSGFQSADGVTWAQVGATVTVTLGSSPRVGLAATSNIATASMTATFTNVSVLLPLGTDANDIGSASIGSYATFSPSTNAFSLSGSAVDANGNGDEIGFVNRAMLGEGSLVTTITGFGTSPATSSTGLMVRSALTAGSPYAGLTVTPAGQLRFRWRLATNGAVSNVVVNGSTVPVSLKLERENNVIRAYYSADRIAWTQIGTAQTIGFASSKSLAGLTIASGVSGSLATAQVSAFSQLGTENNVSLDVGRTTTTGSPIFDTARSTYSMIGIGSGIGATDQLSLAGQTMTGDGDVVSYVSGFASANAAARAGLVLRASTAANSAFIGAFVTSNGLSIAYRAANGGALSTSLVVNVNGPLSFKLSRVANLVSVRYSTNGTTWSLANSGVTIALGTSPIAGMAVASGSESTFTSASFTGFDAGTKLPTGAGLFTPADEAFLNDLEARSVLFYYNETNATTGLVPDGSSAAGGNPSASASIASVGFGLSALVLADERGFLTHSETYQRALNTVNFLYNNAAHVNGFFYHFLNPTTGARAGTSELSPIDTALLMAGVLHAAEYWSGTALATTATNLFNRVNWTWMQKPNGQFYGHWTPENGFEFGYGDFSEAVLLYLLGLGSTTHPISTASWNSWLRTPVVTYSGSTFVTAQTKALFTVQYPMAWFDLRGKTDSFGLNYFDNAAKATLAQRTLAINLSGTYPQYGANNWGLTAADGPNGYTVWGGPPATSNVDGSVVPTAPGGSLAFTPRQSVDALRYMQSTYPTTYKKYGFVDAFNPHTNWTSSIVLGIDVGMMLLSAENARSGSIWDSFSQTAVAQNAMVRAFGSAVTGEDSSADQSQRLELASVTVAMPRERDRVVDLLFADDVISSMW